MYELFDHTADLGLRVEAAGLPELLAEAGRGLCAMLVDNPEDVRAAQSIEMDVPGSPSDPEYLLFDWLTELLHRFESEGLLLREFEITLHDAGLHAAACGEPADPGRHQLAHEVKAVTYHGLRVEQTGRGWRAEVIVDI